MSDLCTDQITKFKTNCTDIFWLHKVQNRPATVPPHSINGGSAAMGGIENPLSQYELDLEELRRQEYPEVEVPEDSEQDDEANNASEDRGFQARTTSTSAEHTEQTEEDDQEDEGEVDDPSVDPPFVDPNDYSSMPFSHKAKGRKPKGQQPTAKPLKPLNIGGSRDAVRKSGTRNGVANQMSVMVNAMGQWRAEDKKRDEEREKLAAEEKAAARKHELEMIKLIFGAGPSSGP